MVSLCQSIIARFFVQVAEKVVGLLNGLTWMSLSANFDFVSATTDFHWRPDGNAGWYSRPPKNEVKGKIASHA